MSATRILWLLLAASVPAPVVALGPPPGRVSVWPAVVSLDGKAARQQLLVSEQGGKSPDRTRSARYLSETPGVVAVSAAGVVTPVGDGEGIVSVIVGTDKARTVVRVKNAGAYRAVTFERDVEPILGRAGCNAGACHGKARGQNGFALSLLGFDQEFDYHAIVNEARGRRIFPASPESSLFLRKASGEVPHGGGKKLPAGTPGHELVRRWIVAGCPRTPTSAPTLSRIVVEPADRVLANKAEQQLAVTAHYADGTTEDVTHLATYQSNDSVYVAVEEHGKMKAGPLPGEATIMARYMEKFGTCHVLVPLPGAVPAELYVKLPRNNFIDGHVWDKLRLLGITPSDSAADHTFHRRAFLSVIGTLPTPDETRAFLADKRSDKRSKLIDDLLARPEYADFWANKWADLLRPNPYRVGIKAVYNLDAWLRDAFRRNKPYDQFVREILTARGSTFRNGATVVFRDRREPDEIAPLVGQLFLGIRLDCAKCHHHPFEAYGQDDYYGLAAYFARIRTKNSGEFGLFGQEQVIYVAESGEVRQPRSGKIMAPRPLRAAPADDPGDRRRALSRWITAKDNPWLSRNVANRYWGYLMGRGLVNPIDDLRDTNPASNPELLDALARSFADGGFDLKSLLRTIMTSRVYGLSSLATPDNRLDQALFTHYSLKRLTAEQMLDALNAATGTMDKFAKRPAGTRAISLPDTSTQSYFLDTFGRPTRATACECERGSSPTLGQALHLMNSELVQGKLAQVRGRLANAMRDPKLTDETLVQTLYRATFGRPATAEEVEAARDLIREAPDRAAGAQDLFWGLLNSKEFLFNH